MASIVVARCRDPRETSFANPGRYGLGGPTLHVFEIDGKTYGPPDFELEEDEQDLDENGVAFSATNGRSCARFSNESLLNVSSDLIVSALMDVTID